MLLILYRLYNQYFCEWLNTKTEFIQTPATIWLHHVAVTPCLADVVCRLRVCLHLVLELFASIAEIQTHVQQLVVQKHISFDYIFNCSNGSPLWGPWNVSESMNLTVSITCKVRCVIFLDLYVITQYCYRYWLMSNWYLSERYKVLTLLLETLDPKIVCFKYVCIIIDNASFAFLI